MTTPLSRMLIITDAWHPQVNGVVRTYEHLVGELQKKGHNVLVIGPSDFPISFPLPGYSEIRLALASYSKLSRMIENFNPNHIHLATEGPLGWAGRKYCINKQIPFTTAYHTQFPDYVAARAAWFIPKLYEWAHKKTKAWVKHFHEPSNGIMVSTPSVHNQLKAWAFDNPLYHVSRGVDFNLFHPGPKASFQDLKKPIALYVGRVSIEKNIEDFLKMEWNGSKVVVGEGPLLNTVKRKYSDVRFLGSKTKEALASCYRSADIFVFPSRTDTFGIVLIEAMASGLPIAAYDVTGPRDIVKKPFLGTLDADDLSQAAYKALECGTAEERTAYAKHHYTWETAATEFEDGLNRAALKNL